MRVTCMALGVHRAWQDIVEREPGSRTSHNCGILNTVVAIDGPFGRYRILPSVLFSPFLFALTDQPQLSHVRSQRDSMSLHFIMAPQSGPGSFSGSYHPW